MADEENVKEKKTKAQPEDNIERLKKIKKKKELGNYPKYLAAAGAAIVVVSAVAVIGTLIGKSAGGAGTIKVETVAASLETTAPVETEPSEPQTIVLETTLSEEEIQEKEQEAAVKSVLDGYANLGIAGVSGYLNVRKTPEALAR